ncbi:MAG: DNA polymerase III subunit epsilon [Rhizobiales bacterium]|nr:DNA polymerase III subunit epsilon [Hyphomicrobiales bacterium]
MREVVLDTETTGLEHRLGHRVVEIGALELLNHIPTGRTFHTYINPEREMPPEAEAIHGLGTTFLKDKPVFASIVDGLLDFVADSPIIIHNASFDVGFLNAELTALGRVSLAPERIIDTLHLARQKHPAGPNSLDALCKRYGIDSSLRSKHGALLDSELLADVYLELIGGRQTALSLASAAKTLPKAVQSTVVVGVRLRPLASRLSEEEKRAHAGLIAELSGKPLWNS